MQSHGTNMLPRSPSHGQQYLVRRSAPEQSRPDVDRDISPVRPPDLRPACDSGGRQGCRATSENLPDPEVSRLRAREVTAHVYSTSLRTGQVDGEDAGSLAARRACKSYRPPSRHLASRVRRDRRVPRLRETEVEPRRSADPYPASLCTPGSRASVSSLVTAVAHRRSSSAAIGVRIRTLSGLTPARPKAAAARTVAPSSGARWRPSSRPICSPSSWTPQSISFTPWASTSHALSVEVRGIRSRSVSGSSAAGRCSRRACSIGSRHCGLSLSSLAFRAEPPESLKPPWIKALRRSIVSGALMLPEGRLRRLAISPRLSCSVLHQHAILRRVGSEARNFVLSSSLAIIYACLMVPEP
jgi:hypothetical protein